MSDNIKKTYHSLPSALSVYQRYESNQLTFDDLSRTDLHFSLKTASDILIEESGIHVVNPFKFHPRDIYKWSLEQNENVELVITNWLEHYQKIKKKYDQEIIPTYKPYYDSDGFDTILTFDSPDKCLTFLRERIEFLRKNDDSFEASIEIAHRRKNCFDILYHMFNKNLEHPVLKLYLDELSTTNQVTILQSVYEEEPKPDLKPGERYTPYSHKQRTYTIGEVLELLTSKSLNERDKTTRPLVLSNSSGRRIVGDEAYLYATNFQIFDIDLKFSRSFNEKYTNASEVRDELFNRLKHYPWLLGITLSSSGRALHVYTKSSRMHNLFVEDEANQNLQKFWFRTSYIQKHAAIAYCLKHFSGIEIYDKSDLVDGKAVIDASLARIGQGIAMNYDPEAKWSTNYVDLYPVIFYHIPPVPGIEPEEWLLHPAILKQYESWFYDNALQDETNVEVQRRQGSMTLIVDDSVEVDGVKQIDMNALGKGDKYSTRWRICNTIISAYGDTELGRQLCHHILQTTKTNTVGTINSFIRSAVINRKEADIYTIRQLKSLGVRIGIDEETTEQISDDSVDKVKFVLEQSEYGFVQTIPDKQIQLNDDEFLGMSMKHVLSSLQPFKVNVIESAPNTGKTEFFKSLARTSCVCLVIPFTSTIESKIVSDDSINELFDVYYGDRKVSEIAKGRSVVMTFDKFSMMPKSKYAIFDYIAIDESHLLFTSTYRLPVVSQTIENIRTFLLDDCSEIRSALNQVMSVQNIMSWVIPQIDVKQSVTKFILMSGTLTGELDYFKFYGLLHYIKVHKLHPYKKHAQIVLSKTAQTRDYLIFKEIADMLLAGHKVIHPTNKGDVWAKKVVSCVEHILDRTISFEYYKRANSDELFVEGINKDTTVNDIELLFCSDYLSVGIDIKDIGGFHIVFSDDFTAESIEQFNNRLRNTDINCKVFFDILDSDGMQKPNIVNTNHIEYVHNEELAHMISDERAIANLQKSIQNRSQYFAILGEMFSKYFIQDFAGNIKYVRSAFEIEQFELQYNVIARSLLYIKSSLQKKYNYTIDIKFEEEVSEATLDKFSDLQKDAKHEHDLFKSKSFIDSVTFLASTKVYDVMQKRDYVMHKDMSELIDDNDNGWHLGYNAELLGGSFIITWNKRHKLTLERAKKFVKRLRVLYSEETVQAILATCINKSGIVNKADIARYERLMRLLFDDRKHTLSSSTREILKISYDWVNPEEEKTALDRFDYETMKSQIRENVELNFVEITNSVLKSKRRKDNVDILVGKFIDTLFKKRMTLDTVTMSFRKIHQFDSKTVKQSIERDQIFRRILLNDTSVQDAMSTHDLAEQHIDENIIVISS